MHFSKANEENFRIWSFQGTTQLEGESITNYHMDLKMLPSDVTLPIQIKPSKRNSYLECYAKN